MTGSGSIGSLTQPFGGHFDGRGHTVTYTVKAGEKEHGLFPYLAGTEDVTAEVRDLKVVVEEYSPKKDAAGGALVCRAEKSIISGVSVTLNKYTAPAESAGGSGLVGTVEADALIENCYVKAAAGAYSKFGGVAYENRGTVKNCEFLLLDGASTLGNYGGIACLNAGKISECRASLPEAGVGIAVSVVTTDADGTVVENGVSETGGMVGGIAGKQTAGAISACESVFNAAAGKEAHFVGGLAAKVTGGAIENSTARGSSVHAGAYTGGLAGFIADENSTVRVSGCVSEIHDITVFGRRMIVNSDQTNLENPKLSYVFALAGGLVGKAYVAARFEVADCVSRSNLAVHGRNSGGLIGQVEYADNVAGLPTFAMKDCSADDISVWMGGQIAPATENRNTGGAIGEVISGATEVQTLISDCVVTAEFTADDTITHVCVGGFVGGVYSNESQRVQAAFTNCRAYGKLSATRLHAAGGFVGLVYDQRTRSQLYGTGRNVAFSGCTASVDIAASEQAIAGNGGFVGYAGFYGRFENCSASGNLSLAPGSHHGGFIGFIAYIPEGGTLLFRSCTAKGSVSRYPGETAAINYTGGFSGYSATDKGFLRFEDCTAYGNAEGASCGGFAARVHTTVANGVTFTDCTAYGNAKDLAGDAGLDCGGFVSWLSGGAVNAAGDPVVAAVLTNCKAYGSATGTSTKAGIIDCGGLVGACLVAARIENCASYAKQLVGATNVIGGLIGSAVDGVEVSGCTYTLPAGVTAMVGSAYAAIVTDKGGNGVVTPPALNCAGALSNGSDLTISLTNLSGITGYVTELAVSLDGKWFTQLVYTDPLRDAYGVLVVDIAGAKTASGQLTAQNFSVTLKRTGAAATADITVRIAFSDGFGRTFILT